MLGWLRNFKKAFELSRVGVNGLAPYPNRSVRSLLTWHRRNELVFACVQKKAESSQDPEPVVEVMGKSGLWERVAGHPLRRLMMRPNPEMNGAEFMSFWVTSEQVAGFFAAEIVRSKSGAPVQLWPLNPTMLKVKADGSFRYGDDVTGVDVAKENVFYTKLTDLVNPFAGVSPLSVALATIEADSQQTDYVRAFFDNAAIPSGIIKIKGQSLTEAAANAIRRKWMKRFGGEGEAEVGPVVLDENADYQKIGASLNEIDNSVLRQQSEARICAVFGVPPLLVGAYVGLVNVNQRASAIEANKDFWVNTMSPMFKRFRTILTWQLLVEFEGLQRVQSEQVRVSWDMSNVMALQEDVASKHMRAREDFRAGAITLNQFEETIGLPVSAGGDYYLRQLNRVPVNSSVVAAQSAAAITAMEAAVSIQLTGGRDAVEDEPKALRKSSGHWKYVAEGDGSTCKACEDADGQTAEREDNLTPVPNPKCGDGYGKCRCRHEFVEG